ncbi:3-deoxy-manno-octulosonate cytidylyltransferase [bacterium]|nr:3-deoxy-manno-octulosonate cytidylyltransferase [bacterium]
MGSTRFPGKPLAELGGKPMVLHVWENARTSRAGSDTFILTDSKEIKLVCNEAGADVIMTPEDVASGTERIGSAMERLSQYDLIVNLQGDEPFFTGESLDLLMSAWPNEKSTVAASCYFPISSQEAKDPNRVKVVLDNHSNAIYFSRSPIPYGGPFYKHIGVYLYKKDFILAYLKLNKGILEVSERLEQLRILENGYKIKMVQIFEDTLGIDTPEDMKRAEEKIGKI